ncbi:T9SS type A sorting domain-containing protein, partial [candidate division WOR-3 bacterium]|nr:T9SS type A sorting domain-containing protein [candidate division WOR-3 bacterium]
FTYAGENNYMDRILPVSPAFSLFTNGGYDRTVAYDEGTYKTIGSSFELGGLVDGTFPSTKDNLIEEILGFLDITTGIEEYEKPTSVLGRISAFPNPATDHLSLSTTLRKTMQVSIDFYNVLGQRVKRLVHSTLPPGEHEFEWNFHDEKNRRLAPGTYFYRVNLGDEVLTGKVLLIE